MKRIETSREPWVGFAMSPRARAGAKKYRIADEIAAVGAIAQHLPLFISSAGLASWLATPSKFEARLGAKLRFQPLAHDALPIEEEQAFGGTYISLVVPKQIVLTTERHGEISISLRQVKDLTDIVVSFNSSLLPEEVEPWQGITTSALSRLRTKVGASPAAKASA